MSQSMHSEFMTVADLKRTLEAVPDNFLIRIEKPWHWNEAGVDMEMWAAGRNCEWKTHLSHEGPDGKPGNFVILGVVDVVWETLSPGFPQGKG